MNKILFVGLDVDDRAFHLCGVTNTGEEQFQFSCKPNAGILGRKLIELGIEPSNMKMCYEATYLGFSLQRDLKHRGFDCDVIAPSLVPVVPGERVKTNRLDCRKLAIHLSKNDLTAVHIPTEEEEAVRDLVRGRKFLTEQLKRQKHYVLSLCRRQGCDYRGEQGKKASYWTQPHFLWLERQVRLAKHYALKFNLGSAIDEVKRLQVEIESYEQEIEKIAEQPFYRRRVEALCCFRGISLVTAMTLITEIGDANRFAHPTQIASYAGMDICEYSSNKQLRWSITKMGNRHLRTTAVECVQLANHTPRMSKRLKAHREGVDKNFIEIADRRMKRLYEKSSRLLFAGKEKNKVKVAAARELLCFVWEALRAASATDQKAAA